MTVHVCFDTETLSLRANAVVLSIGICVFDDQKWQPYDNIVEMGIELFIDRDAQIDAGRDVSQEVLNWWSTQGEEARRVLEPAETIHPRDFYAHWEAFCNKHSLNMNWLTKNARFYVRGPHFDVAIMEDLFATFNVSPPWKFYKVRDIRTWLECHGLDDNLKLKKPASMIPHNALHDAAFDAYMMLEVLHKPSDKLEYDDGAY